MKLLTSVTETLTNNLLALGGIKMKEYISRKWLEKLLDRHLSNSKGAEHYAYSVIKQEINYDPTLDSILIDHLNGLCCDTKITAQN